jgi:hypothetical protein
VKRAVFTARRSAPVYPAPQWRTILLLADHLSVSRSNGAKVELASISGGGFPRQNQPDLREFVGLGIHFNKTCMLFDDDVMANRETETGALSGWFCCEERIEHLFLDLGRYGR